MTNYKKFALPIAVAAALSSSHTHAASFDFDNFTLDWDTVIIAGATFRIEDRDPVISEGSTGLPGDKSLNTLPPIIDNAFILNSNDGNNNFDKGLTTQRLSLLTEMDMNFGDFGFFARGKIWQDRLYGGGTDIDQKGWESYNANPMYGNNGGYNAAFGEFNPAAEDYLKQGAELLDFFFYGTFELPYEREVSVRLGRQVISWGEALLSGGGLATAINPVDANIRSQAGFELKELFLPTGALYLQTQLTDSISLQAYYQYEWEPVIIDPSSSFMNEFDSIGDGGNTFLFVTGQEDILLGKDMNIPVGPDVSGSDVVDPTGGTVDDYRRFYEFLPTNCVAPGTTNPNNGYSGAGVPDDKYYQYRQNRCNALVSHKVKTDEASNTGQFGLAMNVFRDNGDQMGFYFVRYHEKVPSFILPIDSIDEFAPIIDLLVNAVDPSNPIEFNGINDLGTDLSAKQLDALLTFLSVLPEDQGTIGSIANDLVENPWKLGISDVTGGNAVAQAILKAFSQGGANFILGPMGFSSDSQVRSLNYRIKYFEDVNMFGFTYSTILGTANVATEISYRQDTPLLAGDVPRTPTPSNLWNWHINTLMVFEPVELWGIKLWDFASFTAEVLYWNAPGKLPYDEDDLTNGKRLAVQNSPQGVGASMFMGLEYYNVFSGWDISVPLYVNWGVDGSQFNAGYRDGQVTFATGLAFKHLSGVEIGSGIGFNFGDTDDIFQTLVSDRDNAQLYVKYSF